MIQPLTGKAQRSTQLATHRLNIWEGSVRSGKTVASLLAWLLFTRSGPAGNLLMVGKTERTLKRNVIDPLIDMLGPKRARYVQGTGELWLLGRRIYVAGANDESAQDRIRGLTLAGAYVDEATVIPESFWSMLLTRLSVDDARLYATTNPDNPRHWLMRDYLQRAAVWLRHDGTLEDRSGEAGRLDLARFSFRLADNPNLSPAYVAALAAEFVGLWRLRFIEGLWVLAEGAIFDALDSTPGPWPANVTTGLPAGVTVEEWVVAVDYGTTNPFVALLIGHTSDDRLYVAREWRWDSRARRRQQTDAEYSAALRSWLDSVDDDLPGAGSPRRIHVDPSAASFIAQLWRDSWAGVHGADNTVADGIRAVANLVGAHRVVIDESCDGLIGELVGYVWDPKAAERGVEQPLKVDDHGPDALRYGVMGTRRWWRHWLTVEVDAEAA